MFCSVYSVYVNVSCIAATGCQPNCNYIYIHIYIYIYHIFRLLINPSSRYAVINRLKVQKNIKIQGLSFVLKTQRRKVLVTFVSGRFGDQMFTVMTYSKGCLLRQLSFNMTLFVLPVPPCRCCPTFLPVHYLK
jgi:hypothetical protein